MACLLFFLPLLFCWSLVSAQHAFRVAHPVVSVWTMPRERLPYPATMPCQRPVYGFHTSFPDRLVPCHNTQLMYGDRVFVSERTQGISADGSEVSFCKVQFFSQFLYAKRARRWMPFEGWIKEEDLVEESQAYLDAKALCKKHKIIKTKSAEVFCQGSHVETVVLFGTIFPVLKESIHDPALGCVDAVLLSSGAVGFVRSTCLREPLPLTAHPAEVYAQLEEGFSVFEGSGYVWGGCSAPVDLVGRLTGVDCSGLMYLLFRSIGYTVPRNAVWQQHYVLQYKDDLSIPATFPATNLIPGDLLFYQRGQGGKTTHVLMFVSHQQVYEIAGAGDDMSLHRVKFTDFNVRMSRPLAAVHSGDKVVDGTLPSRYRRIDAVYFGSYLRSQKLLADARERFLKSL